MFVPNFNILGEVVPEKSVTKILLEKKKNGQIKGVISMRMLNLSYNFVDANFPKYCMREMGKKKKKITILAFSYTIYFTIVKVYTKFEASEKSVMNFNEKERKMDK